MKEFKRNGLTGYVVSKSASARCDLFKQRIARFVRFVPTESHASRLFERHAPKGRIAHKRFTVCIKGKYDVRLRTGEGDTSHSAAAASEGVSRGKLKGSISASSLNEFCSKLRTSSILSLKS